MKVRFCLMLLVAVALALVLQPATRAGDKDKDEPKKEKKEEPRDVVVNGELINADLKDKVRGGSYCKMYTFKMIEGKSYQIDMRSNDFDSYLRLENPEGVQVAFDDDGGGFPHARITYRAPKTGDYQIIATTFAGGALGKYQLIVKDLTPR